MISAGSRFWESPKVGTECSLTGDFARTSARKVSVRRRFRIWRMGAKGIRHHSNNTGARAPGSIRITMIVVRVAFSLE